MSTPAFEDFRQKFRIGELMIKRFEHWTWSVRPVQGTLGATIISMNRPALAWGQATLDENAELALVVSEAERRLSDVFQYSKINYLMLMMVDDHVHFHVFPRYSAAVLFQGKEWVDVNWPKPPDLLNGERSSEVLSAVQTSLLT